MENHYLVKFKINNKTHYGIVNEYSEYKNSPDEYIVEDAVLPKSYRVKEKDLIDLPHTLCGKWVNGQWTPEGEYNIFVDQEFNKAEKLSNSLPKGLCVGKLFGTGVGDGTAYYVITKVNKKTCKIEWRGFSPDRWVDRHFGYGGSFPNSMIARFVR